MRDHLFDNYKAFLIFLVVVGHFIGPSVPVNSFLLLLKWIIVSFHMPAFVFISGYFSKREQPFRKIVRKLAVPYLAYEVLYYLWYTFVTHKDTELALLKPKFTLWYLLALFLWRIVTPYVKKIPHYMILAVLAGLLIGYSNMENNLLTIPRALFFYPFYLAGTNLDRETLNRFQTKKYTAASLSVIAVLSILLILVGLQKAAPMQIFYGRYNYASMNQGMLEGLLWRIFSYLTGFFMIFAWLFVMPDRELPFSYIGTRTMAVYLFHGLTYTYLEQCTTLLEGIRTPGRTLLFLIGCAFLTVFFSLKPFTKFTNLFS